MNAVDRAAEVLASIFPLGNGQSWPDLGAEALAAADPPLLVTDEIQAVLDAAERTVLNTEFGALSVHPIEHLNHLAEALDDYLASRGEP